MTCTTKTPLPQLGKVLRKLRIDRDEDIADMAARLGFSVEEIEGIETGLYQPPLGTEARVINAYLLHGKEGDEVVDACDLARNVVSFHAETDAQRRFLGHLSRRFGRLSEASLRDIVGDLKLGVHR